MVHFELGCKTRSMRKGPGFLSPCHKTEGNETDKLIRTLSRLPYESNKLTSSPEDTSVEISTSKILEMLLTLPLWLRARCLPSVVMPTRLTATKPLLPPSLMIARGKEADALASFSEFPSAQSLGYPWSQGHILVKKYSRLLLYSELKDMLNRF